MKTVIYLAQGALAATVMFSAVILSGLGWIKG